MRIGAAEQVNVAGPALPGMRISQTCEPGLALHQSASSACAIAPMPGGQPIRSWVMHIELFGSMPSAAGNGHSARDLTIHRRAGYKAASDWRQNASDLLRDVPEEIAHADTTISCMSSLSKTGDIDRSKNSMGPGTGPVRFAAALAAVICPGNASNHFKTGGKDRTGGAIAIRYAHVDTTGYSGAIAAACRGNARSRTHGNECQARFKRSF